MSLTVGSLCTGTNALELGLAQVLDVEPLWFADPDPGAAALLAHRYPNVPNLGDLTGVDWRAIRRPDIVTMGFPCQDISLAGLRAGMRAGNRSGLWFHIAEILDELRPGLVVIENVRSLLTARGAAPTPELIAAWAERDRYARVLDLIDAKLDRARKRAQRDRFQQLTADRVRVMGRHRRAVAAGQRADARIIRAVGAVLGDLADLGFDAEWVLLPASGVGAPHQRQRVFLVAAATDAGRGGIQRWRHPAGDAGAAAAEPEGDGRPAGAQRRDADDPRRRRAVDRRGGKSAADTGGPAGRRARPGDVGDDRGEALRRRPAEPGRCGGAAADPAREGLEGLDEQGGRPAPGLRRRPAQAAGEAAADPEGDRWGEGWPEPIGEGEAGAGGDRGHLDWADYAPAIQRWERVLGRAAPAPTVLGARGACRLSPRFVEWMMGLPAGWVTDVPGLTRNQQLKMLGNGVVMQQAAAALRLLLPRLADVEAVA